MAIGSLSRFSTILALGALSLLVARDGDQWPLLFLSTSFELEALNFPIGDGNPPPFFPLSSFLEFKTLLLSVMTIHPPFLLSHLF
jgi:hypothetical protein